MSPNLATPATPRLVAVRGWSRPRSGSDSRLLRAKALADRAEHKLETAVTSTPVLVPLDPIEREGRAVP